MFVKDGTEKILVKAAWDEQVLVKEAWSEEKQVLVSAAWDEKVLDHYEMVVGDTGSMSSRPVYTWIHHDAEYKTETINHPAEYKTVNHPAEYKTETINHPAEYQEVDKYVQKTKTIHHEAEYQEVDRYVQKTKTVHHPAEYKEVDRYIQKTKTVHHEAEYKEVPEYKTVHHEAEYQEIKHEAETKQMEVWYDENGVRTDKVREIGATKEENIEDITNAAPENIIGFSEESVMYDTAMLMASKEVNISRNNFYHSL